MANTRLQRADCAPEQDTGFAPLRVAVLNVIEVGLDGLFRVATAVLEAVDTNERLIVAAEALSAANAPKARVKNTFFIIK